MAVVAFIANVFLAKVLPKVVFGKLGFAIIIAPFLAVMSLVGQNVWLLRLIAVSENTIRWKHLATKAALRSSGITAVLVLIVFVWAEYSVPELALVVVIGVAHMVTYLVASCLRGAGRDILGLVLVRLIPLFLLVIACICYLTGYNTSLFVLSLLAFGHVVECIIAVFLIFAAKDGEIEPQLARGTSSGAIYFYNMSTFALLQSYRFVCKIIYGFEGYAVYHAAKIIVRPIQLVLEMMDYYSLPRLATAPYMQKVRQLIYESLIIAAMFGIGYGLGGNAAFKYLFGDEFASQTGLVLSLAVLELLALVQLPLANLVQAIGSNRQLTATGFVGIMTLVVAWCAYALMSAVRSTPMAVLPICVGVAYVIRAVVVWKGWASGAKREQ